MARWAAIFGALGILVGIVACVVAGSPDPATRPTVGPPVLAETWRPTVGPVAGSGDPATTSGHATTAIVLADDPKPAKSKEPRNLVPNGDFEEGDGTPKGWQTIDGLTTFWFKDDDPKRGKVIKFDTDVLQSQGYDWWVKIAGGAK